MTITTFIIGVCVACLLTSIQEVYSTFEEVDLD
jgi:hypothetical protein